MSHDHPHPPSATQTATRRLTLALLLTVGLVAAEIIAGVLANSLALLTDAAHNATDAIALVLSWIALRLATQPANSSRTFGYHRAGILVALVNAITLGAISVGIFNEALQRLRQPPEIQAGVLVGVGVLAFVINLVSALLLHADSQHDLNLRSTYLHMLGDVLSTLGAVVAGVLILLTGWRWLDALVSLLIGILILWNAFKILREAVDILLESTPRDVDMPVLIAELQRVPGVHEVHDLHVWSITQGLRMVSAHVVIDNLSIAEGAEIQGRLTEVVQGRYGIGHATWQLECAECSHNHLYCNLSERHSPLTLQAKVEPIEHGSNGRKPRRASRKTSPARQPDE